MVEQQFLLFTQNFLHLQNSAVVSKQTFLEYFMNYAFSSSELNDDDPVLSSAIELQTGGKKTSITALVKV